MNEYLINILDSEGCLMMTILSPTTTFDEDKYAELFVSPLLPVLAEAYKEKVFYRIHKRGE